MIDVINKYDTNINIDNLNDEFKNMILVSDEAIDCLLFHERMNLTMDDIKEPDIKLIEDSGDDLEIYNYSFNDYFLKISHNLTKNSISIIFMLSPSGLIYNPTEIFIFDDKGKRII